MELQSIFIPLIIAFFLFFIFQPLNNFLINKKIPSAIVLLLDISIVVSVFVGVSTFIVDSFSSFFQELPSYESSFNELVKNTALSMRIHDKFFTDFSISNVLQQIDYTPMAGSVFTSTVSLLGYMIFVLFFFIFIFSGYKNLYKAIKKRYVSTDSEYINSKENFSFVDGHFASEEGLKRTFSAIVDNIQKYLIAKTILSLFTGLVVGFILYLFNVKFFVIWGVLSFILNFIPNIGSIIGVVLPTVMVLIQYGSFGYAAMVAGTVIVIHNLIGNIVEPKIFGKQLGINPLVILLSLLVWGYIWGIAGMVLSVPLTVIGKIIVSKIDSRNLRFINDLMGD
jgi:predicted PurR-regulated permease PerM